MIRRLTRWLLALQGLAVAGVAWALLQLAHLQSPALALALGVGLVVAIRLSITASGFYLAWRYRSETPAPYRINRRMAARLFCTEFSASMISASWSMPFFRVGKRPAAQPEGLPVLLIHGYGCNSGYWRSMSRRLSAANITHHGIDLEPPLAGIDSYVPAIARAVDTLARDSHCRQVILVVHSMGGLISRAYLREHGCDRLAAVITLGTPHHGTALARGGIGINSQQMCCSADNTPSAWLQQLAGSETTQTRGLFTTIYSHHDNIVSPQCSAHLEGATNLAVAGIGHVALGMDSGIQERVIARIRQVVASRPVRQNRSSA
ncbi:alpha/beta fold hydrolase [Actimicrobium sp. CCC2.4]|uniref:esterase/lipase family protein n=1 Tax=Actimicrobium sp. CCC2.4 TaxID=3048606 RepID=UPI002AC8C8B9|nr:alpha/beta fold hydrolase [Actimicrobium sp. CCC2.4]MEB0135656.1 alpha/beta fold hydrolase [Actimicrobium sp. CCC2.4]WPX33782.1 alpha/beta fold hydrolase [Actimicrobium sp. CCC2.4]